MNTVSRVRRAELVKAALDPTMGVHISCKAAFHSCPQLGRALFHYVLLYVDCFVVYLLCTHAVAILFLIQISAREQTYLLDHIHAGTHALKSHRIS
jgi:hypothetical protein